PDVGSLPHMREKSEGQDYPHQKDADPDPEIGAPLARHVEHGEENTEEEQRAPQIILKGEQEQGQKPGEKEGAEILEGRKAEAAQTELGQRQHLALLLQISSVEDNHQDFENLHRLEVDVMESEPAPVRPSRNIHSEPDRAENKQKARHGGRVFIAFQVL